VFGHRPVHIIPRRHAQVRGQWSEKAAERWPYTLRGARNCISSDNNIISILFALPRYWVRPQVHPRVVEPADDMSAKEILYYRATRRHYLYIVIIFVEYCRTLLYRPMCPSGLTAVKQFCGAILSRRPPIQYNIYI